jgi:hypothetical protein
MAFLHSRLRPHGSACLILLLLAVGCQSERAGADADDGFESDSAERAASDAVRVRGRDEGDSDPSGASGSAASDAGPQGSSGDDELESAPEPGSAGSESTAAPVPVFAACISSGGASSDCETLFVTAIQAEPERCIQLTIDSCGTYDRQGLSADAPTSWRLASGSVGSDIGACELGVFYPGTSSLADATGSITWDQTAPDPTDVTFDLSLELAGLAGQAQTIELATSEPLRPTECEE